MEIINKKFNELNFVKEGIVLLGAGGDLQEWINGVSNILKENDIVKTNNPEELWEEAIQLTTTGGRTDLMLTFKNMDDFHMGKMAIWRLNFGDCSWIRDYMTNYADQHGFIIGDDEE